MFRILDFSKFPILWTKVSSLHSVANWFYPQSVKPAKTTGFFKPILVSQGGWKNSGFHCSLALPFEKLEEWLIQQQIIVNDLWTLFFSAVSYTETGKTSHCDECHIWQIRKGPRLQSKKIQDLRRTERWAHDWVVIQVTMFSMFEWNVSCKPSDPSGQCLHVHCILRYLSTCMSPWEILPAG